MFTSEEQERETQSGKEKRNARWLSAQLEGDIYTLGSAVLLQ
jgi:hypothetical protein